MSGASILIVEDNPVNLKLVKLILTMEGYIVKTSVNAADALNILDQFHPDLILMDLQLPGKNGLDLTRELKSNAQFKDILIIALTAYAMKGDEEIAKAAGCDGYITKPISVDTFPKEIAQYLEKQANASKRK